jgi:hypothetical protein
LAGADFCGDCETPLTAYWSKGRNNHHPYYLRPKRGCESCGKSIRRNVIEEEFEQLLHTMQPFATLFKAARELFKDLWDHRLASSATVPSVIAAYETRIKALEDRKIVLAVKIIRTGRPVRSFDDTVRTTIEFLASPWQL